MKWLKNIILSAGVVCLVIVISAAAFVRSQDDIYFAIKKNLGIFGALYEELAVGYVDQIDPERLMRTGLESMLETLDPYTVFIDEAANEEIDIVTRGRYAGVGLTVAMNNGAVTVVNPIEGYSGFKQGVRAGDIITEVGDRAIDGLTVDDVSQILRGDPGSTVRVLISREGETAPVEFILTREEVKLKNVTYADFLEGTSIGYIRLERFAREAYGEVHTALKTLRESGELEGVIVDVRDNPGGLLEAAVDISGIFLPQGTEIVSTRGRLPQTHRSYRSRKAPVDTELPLVILVNGNSASASEIVAGAIQDLDRGVILGERTFGKGLVQIVRQLPYNTSLKMTTSKYYTPAGRSIQAITYTHRAEDGYAVEVADSLQRAFSTASGRQVLDGGGIDPDVEIALDPLSDFEAALLRKSAFFRFANSFAASRESIPEDFVPDDETFGEFQRWLDEDGFEYTGGPEAVLDDLELEVANSGYDLEAEIAELRQSIAEEKAGNVQRHRDVIAEYLRQEILARYYGETAQIRASLVHDPQVKEALEIVSDQGRTRDILK